MTGRDEIAALRVQLEGGLGNQLFQYAAAHSAAIRLGCSLKVAVANGRGLISKETKRSFALSWLVPPVEVVGHDGPGRLVRRIARAYPRATPRGLFIECGFSYDRRILNIQPGTTLIGYFQSWRYFSDCEDDLRTQISRAAPRSSWFEETAHSLASIGQWTAVHIRRGDYTLKRNSTFHGLLGPAYYQSAVDEVRRHIPNGPLVVFSDEPSCASSVLHWLPDDVIVVRPVELNHPMESVMLMAGASAIITANSSFSWWGAWLAGPHVPVVCPATWFKGARYDEADLRPPSWTTVPSDFIAACP